MRGRVWAVDLVLPPTPAPSSTSACEPGDFAGFPAGAIALVQRGTCNYAVKVANAAAAYEAGCRVFDGAAGGIGGCPFAPGASGNTATEDLVWMFRRMGVETGLDWPKLLAAADMAAAIPGAVPGGRLRGVAAARRAA